ncbi:MAG TPA: hypothetical protein VK976_00345 [Verrucomicrobiae bacterium]|jgi:hypothetical protein|nr:hypothetical protein [Verrucomicrobiae bacterium]
MKWGIERSKVLTRLAGMPGCGRLVQGQYDNFLRLKYEVNWRWVRNPASRGRFHSTAPKLNAVQTRLVEELYATGVARCHISELFQDDKTWASLAASAAEFSNSEDVQSVVRKRQEDFGARHDFGRIEHYIIFKYPQDQKPIISADNLLLKFGLDHVILDVANSYIGMWSKLIYFDMWYTLPLNTDTRYSSQRWHRDPEDRRKIRTFLYFSKVDEGSGAMEYMSGSHQGGPFEDVFPWNDPLGIPYPPDGEVERLIPPSQRVVLEGPPGTLVFCDTAGFHRGGVSRCRPRILATSAYVTPASLHGRRYVIDESVRKARWDSAAKYAVS